MTFSEPGPSEPGRTLHLPTGEVLTIIRSGTETGGSVFEVEAILPPRLTGPPAHRHRRRTETFEILEGVLRVRVGDATRDLVGGESVTVTPWTLHAFSNPSAEPTRIRTREIPAGPLEDQFRVLARAGRLPPVLQLARINVDHDYDFHLHGIPDRLQRVLWRALAAAAPRRGASRAPRRGRTE